MKVFIDLGAYEGDTIKEFHRWIPLRKDKFEDYQIYAFEPNPDLITKMKYIEGLFDNVEFKPWAAWTFDGQIDLAVDKTKTPMGSTVMEGKSAIWDHYPHATVKCFNFPQWLRQKFTEDDFIILKMDIEGAEYPILEAMLADSSIKLVDLLLCEFHHSKIPEFSEKYTFELMDRIRATGTKVKEWR